jgi:hypothetical protein
MKTPPNFRDVSKCCGNCGNFDEITETDTIYCKKHQYLLEHLAFLCDDWRNE